MARVTQAQRIEQENEAAALSFFLQTMESLPDPRRRQGVRYPLVSVVTIALMASVCGADNAETMELWGQVNQEWLAGILELPHGPPTQDVYLSVFSALSPKDFGAAFFAFVDLLHIRAPGKHIACDGKTSRRSFDTATGRPALHTVSAWLAEEGLVLGQLKTDDKSNEITALPELLRLLDLRGAQVTIDAMGCQTEIAGVIVTGGGNYLLSVKDNQPALHKDLVATFAQAAAPPARSVDDPPRPKVERFEELDKGHGRLEKRTIALCRDLSWMMTAERWPGLSFLALVTRERTNLTTGKTSTATSYYIGSDEKLSAQESARLIRRHWSIENELHWVLDMAFREDEARHRARHLAQNFATLRHFALNLLKGDSTRKVGIESSRKRAGWDRGYLLALLSAAPR